MALDPLTAQAVLAVREIAGDLLDDGRARLEQAYSVGAGGWMVDLLPTWSDGCPVSFLADDPHLITVFVGPPRARATLELWSKNRHELLEQLRERITAIVNGRYEQDVTVTSDKRSRIKVVGRFSLVDGDVTHTYWGDGDGPFEPGEAYTLRFQPY